MRKRHMVDLSDDQRADLEGRYFGRLTLRERNRVPILLRSDAGDTDDEIADAWDVCVATVAAVRKRFAAAGLEAARNRDVVKICWCFKVADARRKMARTSPQQTPAAIH